MAELAALAEAKIMTGRPVHRIIYVNGTSKVVTVIYLNIASTCINADILNKNYVGFKHETFEKNLNRVGFHGNHEAH